MKISYRFTPLQSTDGDEILHLELLVCNEVKCSCKLLIKNGNLQISAVKIFDENDYLFYEYILREAENYAERRQLKKATLIFCGNILMSCGETTLLERALCNSQWKLSSSQNIFIYDGVRMNEHNWLKRNFLNEKFSVESINSLTDDEIQSIELGRGIWYPDKCYPLQNKKPGSNSLVLRYMDNVIGWCITYAVTKDMLMYDNLFVRKEFWNLGRSISLFGEALRIQCKESPIRYLTFTIPEDSKALMKILQTKTKGYLVDFNELKLWQKEVSFAEQDYKISI